MGVSTGRKTLVQPSVPLVPGFGQLTPFDQYMVRVVLPIMCVFQVGPSADRSTIIDDLQSGLSHTIDELNFLAADVVTEPGEQALIRLEYGDDAGVWFYAKELPEVQYNDLAARNFPLSSLPVSQFSPEPRGHSKRCPALTVQATFISGGLVLTFNIHHSVVDGPAIGTFLQVWSRYTAAAAEGLDLSGGGVLPEGALDSSNIFGAGTARALTEFPLFQSPENRTYESTQAEIMKVAIAGDHDTVAKLNPLSHWLISEENLERLRTAAAPTSATLPAVTDNAAICALVWMHVARARRLAERGVKTSSLLSAVNVRKRMEPPLADEYPSNAIALARATATAEELDASRSHPEDRPPLYELARKVAASVDWWTADEIWALSGAIQAHSPVENSMIPPLDYDVVVTSPAQMVDVLGKCEWGSELGIAKSLRWAFPAFTDGLTVILPSFTGGVEIQLWTAPETAERLSGDASWTSWVAQIK